MKPIYSRIDYHVSKTLSDLRTTELFDIIVSYPDTLPALDDLKVRPSPPAWRLRSALTRLDFPSCRSASQRSTRGRTLSTPCKPRASSLDCARHVVDAG